MLCCLTSFLLAAVSAPPSELPVQITETDFATLTLGSGLPEPLTALAPGAVLVGRIPTGIGPDAWRFEDPRHCWSSATVAARNGTLAGSLRSVDGSLWRLRANLAGEQLVEAVEESALPECGGAVEAPPSMWHEAGAPDVAGCDDGSMVDVLVLYTNDAAIEGGGVASVEAQIAAAIASANVAYGNSQISPRIRAVAVSSVSYTSSDFATDLGRLATPGDSYLDIAQTLRDVVGADLVALIRTNGDYCGIAYLLPSNDPGSSGIGFSVTAWSCLSSQTLAHELGHNMGCCHAAGDGGGCTAGGLYPYSLGWRFNGQSGPLFRTIMAYAPGNRIDNFSNPSVSFDQVATGVPINPVTGDGVNNSLTINQTAYAVANFRCTAPAPPTGDCNNDGLADYLDVANGHDSDCNANGILDACELATVPLCGGAAPTMVCPGGVTQSVKAGSPTAGAHFGGSVAAGSNRVAVGEPSNDVDAADSGRAYLFQAVAEHWALSQTLICPDVALGALFGWAIALDGDTLVVGAPGVTVNGVTAAGKIYVYHRNGAGYLLTQQIPCPAVSTNDLFGMTLALQGGVLAVGAPGHDLAGPPAIAGAGAIFVYRQNGAGLFSLEATLIASTPVAGAELGLSVAVSSERIIAGAPLETSGGRIIGAAYFYAHGATWSQEARIDGSSLSGDARLGAGVAIDGLLAAIGASGDNTAGDGAGSVSTFIRSANAWQPESVIEPGGSATNTHIGATLALSDDRLFVGGANPATAPGHVTLYLHSGSNWAPMPTPYGGQPVSVRHDLAAVGSPFADEGPVDSGSARIVRFEEDCDGDGIADRCAIAMGLVADLNNDGIPDSCQALFGDLDGDGHVNGADLGLLISKWGACAAPCPADLNGDGAVDGADLGLLIAHWIP